MNQRIDPSWIRRFVTLAIMAACIKAGMLVWSFFLPATGVEYIAQQGESLPVNNYRVDAAFGLKGQDSSSPASPSSAPVYKLTSLNLKGIYRGQRTAFILVQDGKDERIIFKGENFQGYTLTDVLLKKAVFEKNGRRYEVDFKDADDIPSPVQTQSVINNGNGYISVKRNELIYYKKNFNAIWQNIKINEQKQNGKLNGFKVTWIKAGSVFAKLGLKKGDIITGINGKPVSSVAEAFKIYQKMDTLENLTIEIKRNNQKRELDYAIYE
jgi:type II secretion system protein C